MKRLLLLFFGVLTANVLLAQSYLTGKITDAVTDQAVDLATIFIPGTGTATQTAADGSYRIEVPIGESFQIRINRVGYREVNTTIKPMPSNALRTINIALVPTDLGVEIIVTDSRLQEGGMIVEGVDELKLLPTTTGNFESVLPNIALGASGGTGGELSSQYNVRGGNYDENLVYVNDFAIYRPQLIRAGQQEGLTFPNIDLISSLSFSSGGFEAKYGDRLSSVLDIKYKRPDSLAASASVSALGATAHVEGSLGLGNSSYRRFRYLIGARYKDTRYLLGSLDVSGEYTPRFMDVQGYFTYDLNHEWQIGVLGNFNRSVFQFTPQSRTTALGLINFALQLFTVFEGQEVDDFTTSLGGVSLTYLPDRDENPLFLKFLASTYQASENERFDILGFYSLRQIESDLGSDEFGEVVSELGTGTQHQWARNFLTSQVTNVEHKGGLELQIEHDEDHKTSSHFFQWGIKYQYESHQDFLNEWERLDSAGYSLPYDTNFVQVFSVLKSENQIQSNRFQAFLQDTYTWRNDSIGELRFSFGLRAAYWDLNKEFFVSPRANILYKPLNWRKDISFRVAGGLYYQPPFYRELRGLDGTVNTDVLAQKSAHLVGGLTWDFYWGKLSPKRFRFITEIYYKRLWDIVSYDIDNVRIRYSGLNDATGYVTGIDMRLNGEFVPGAESWINISFLRARESLNGIQHLQREFGEEEATPVPDVPRPTDQFMNLSVFFQDYLPNNENFKMHLNVTVGTGLPYGLRGNNEVYRNTYRFSPYHRVDIGFSWQLWEQSKRIEKPRHFLRFTKSTWLALEIFNLLRVQNQASNTWIKTIFNQQYAIPNYLTGRRINLRLRMDF
jgi:hypothetical protein